MKASPEEEGRIIAQSRFDVNEEILAHEIKKCWLSANGGCERKIPLGDLTLLFDA